MPVVLLWAPERSDNPARSMCSRLGVGADRGRRAVPTLRSVLR